MAAACSDLCVICVAGYEHSRHFAGGAFQFRDLENDAVTALLRKRRSGETRNVENTPRVTRPLSFANDYQDKRSRDTTSSLASQYNMRMIYSLHTDQDPGPSDASGHQRWYGTDSTCVLPVERCAFHHIPNPSTNCILLYLLLLDLLLPTCYRTPPGQPSTQSGRSVVGGDEASQQPRMRVPFLYFARDLTTLVR
jgi:hypothetical protein